MTLSAEQYLGRYSGIPWSTHWLGLSTGQCVPRCRPPTPGQEHGCAPSHDVCMTATVAAHLPGLSGNAGPPHCFHITWQRSGYTPLVAFLSCSSAENTSYLSSDVSEELVELQKFRWNCCCPVYTSTREICPAVRPTAAKGVVSDTARQPAAFCALSGSPLKSAGSVNHTLPTRQEEHARKRGNVRKKSQDLPRLDHFCVLEAVNTRCLDICGT